MNRSEKGEKFRHLASKRTNLVLQRIRVLGNCSNRSAYDYTEEEVNKIFSEIERGLKETKARFYFPKRRKSEFKL